MPCRQPCPVATDGSSGLAKSRINKICLFCQEIRCHLFMNTIKEETYMSWLAVQSACGYKPERWTGITSEQSLWRGDIKKPTAWLRVKSQLFPAFFKVVVAWCNKITLCRFFFWIQINCLNEFPVTQLFAPALRMTLASFAINFFSGFQYLCINSAMAFIRSNILNTAVLVFQVVPLRELA